MRDPARIDAILDDLRVLWKRHPDLRLGQIVVNAASRAPTARPMTTSRDLFFIEDADHLEAAAKQLKEDGKGYRANQAYIASRKARRAARSLLGNEP